MKKFDLVAKKMELEENRVRDTKETLGTRFTKLFVGGIGAFMMWSVCSTLAVTNTTSAIINILILICFGLYIWKSGVFRKSEN